MVNQSIKPGLYLVASPIGNMEDCSDRMKRNLTGVNFIACEDTREMKKMLSILGIERDKKNIITIHEHNESQMADKIIELIAQGNSVAYVSDAGMPAISDPGQILVDKVLDSNLFVTSIPGPSAVTTAFALSGFRQSEFLFIGFFPRIKKDQDIALEQISQSKWPVVCYESPKRISSTLSLLSKHVGPSRRAVICRELTKKFEQISRGTISQLQDIFSGEVKGECVIVIESSQADSIGPDTTEIENALKVLKSSGVSSKDAVGSLSFITDMPKNKLKELFLNLPSS